jgi:hypothetical protein
MENQEPLEGEKSKHNEESKNNDMSCQNNSDSRDGDEEAEDSYKNHRLHQCVGNLNALHKVQGALLAQLEREI